jgi:hypothetical protein
MMSKSVIAENVFDPFNSYLLIIWTLYKVLGIFSLVGLIGLIAFEDEGSGSRSD